MVNVQNNEVKVDGRKHVKWEDYKGKIYRIEKYLRETKFKTDFNTKNHYVSWIWSPVTGCLNDCLKCSQKINASVYSNSKPLGFIPLLRYDRLKLPNITAFPIKSQDPKDWRVLVCDEGDLFGDWVPDHFIEKVIEATKEAPFFRYLFLTKNPKRYLDLNIDVPQNCWLGARVESQAKADETIKIMQALEHDSIKWIAFDSLLEPINVNLEGIDWIVIGSSDFSYDPTVRDVPDQKWVEDIVSQARKAGCLVYMRNNLFDGNPEQNITMEIIQENPFATSGNLNYEWEEISGISGVTINDVAYCRCNECETVWKTRYEQKTSEGVKFFLGSKVDLKNPGILNNWSDSKYWFLCPRGCNSPDQKNS